MRPNSKRLNELADKEMHKKYLIAHNEYAVDDYKDGYQQAFDDLMAVVIMQREALKKTTIIDNAEWQINNKHYIELALHGVSNKVLQALAESSKLLAELTEGDE